VSRLRRATRVIAGCLLAGALVPVAVVAQSGHLNALEGSAPAGVVEPLAGVFPAGLAALWIDPTAAPRSTGAFFSVHQSSYASIRVVQAIVAFRYGPRWSLAFGQSDIPNLFDTSFTSIDPGLAGLHARAESAALDATVGVGRLRTSGGIAVMRDENVGEFRSSSVGRVHARYAVSNSITLGVRTARAIGGSIAAARSGRIRVDATFARTIGALEIQTAVALSRGQLWQYAETNGGTAIACQATIKSILVVGGGAGWYPTTFGSPGQASYKSVAAGLRIANLRIGGSFTSTELGAGSGYAVSIGYESSR
jgi:hypothetical protein